MKNLGMKPDRTERLALLFKQQDQAMMKDLYKLRQEEHSYIDIYKRIP